MSFREESSAFDGESFSGLIVGIALEHDDFPSIRNLWRNIENLLRKWRERGKRKK